ncbi:hypothetical protein Hanom_Chr06g00569171 [Helianthus anomalus]
MQPKSSPSQVIALKLPPKKNNIEMPWIINNKPHSYSCEMIGRKYLSKGETTTNSIFLESPDA